MTTRVPDLETLARIREKFLSPHPGGLADYWDSERTLDAYDRTFARRIAWKWEAVARAFATAWAGAMSSSATLSASATVFTSRTPSTAAFPEGDGVVPLRRVVDWGCGTGAASVAFVPSAPTGFLDPDATVHPYDRSLRAMDFAAARLREALGPRRVFPAADVATLVKEDTLLLVSHVLTELTSAARADLVALARRAGAVAWVEPGTPFCASGLVEVRETLRAEGFTAIAPCLHAARCGMTREEPERNWCHFFAEPPADVFRDGEWVKLAKGLGIDLRALPVSYVVLVRGLSRSKSEEALVIGRPRVLKGHTPLVLCEPDAIRVHDFQHRSDKAFAKELEKALFHRTIPRQGTSPRGVDE